jgi:hypothetical protein
MESNAPEVQTLLAQTLRSNRRLARWVKSLFAIWAVTVIGLVWVSRADRAAHDDVLKARSLVIVDEHGKTRVRIGAPLPEPIIMGKEQKRDDSISGILIYDALGNERGGYVTDNSVGNAFLTLDSNIGQEVTLVAYPKGGAEFGLNDDEKNKVVMSALKNGPRFRLLRGGSIVADLPSSVSNSSDR